MTQLEDARPTGAVSKYFIRPMQDDDIPQVLNIDHEAFATQWPPLSYSSLKQELRNRMARYVVLCNFDEFWIYDFDTDLDAPKDKLALTELAERWGPLAFLAPGSPAPKFQCDRVAVTAAAADKLALLFSRLLQRGVGRPTAQRFTLQMLIALFAEDIDLLPKYFVTELLEDCSTPASTFDLIGNLFQKYLGYPAYHRLERQVFN